MINRTYWSFFICTIFIFQCLTWLSYYFTFCIWNVLPIHYSCKPISLWISLHYPITKLCMINPSCICCIFSFNWLTNNYFLKWNPSWRNLANRSPWKIWTWFQKQFLVWVIFSISLIIKLYIIKVNCMTYLSIYLHVSPIFIILFFEIWSLRSMRYNMVWQ